eukprot:1188133-Prorocentrum_minimum.AAC.5
MSRLSLFLSRVATTHRVEKGLHALVLEGGAAHHRDKVPGEGALADERLERRLVGLLPLEERHHGVLVQLHRHLHHLLAVLCRLLRQLRANVQNAARPRDARAHNVKTRNRSRGVDPREVDEDGAGDAVRAPRGDGTTRFSPFGLCGAGATRGRDDSVLTVLTVRCGRHAGTGRLGFHRFDCAVRAPRGDGTDGTTHSKDAPRSSPRHTISFICTRSMIPSKLSSAPMGSWMSSGLAPRLVTTMSAVRICGARHTCPPGATPSPTGAQRRRRRRSSTPRRPARAARAPPAHAPKRARPKVRACTRRVNESESLYAERNRK